MSYVASLVSTNPKDEAPEDAALLHLLDGYYIKRHSVDPWNTSGGYCDVFTGDHPTFGKVALKRPRGGLCDESSLRNFRREARVWKRLQHPHILQFVGIIDTSSYAWLVSVFAENGTLREYISTHQDADRHSLVIQFTSGLAYLHSEGVVHGDLKADNLLISVNHHLLIADFGLSKLNGMSTYASKKGVGSLRWMAPELLDEEDAIKTSSSDVYAYGITISEILSGELPFKQYTNISALIRAVLNNKRPPIPEKLFQGNPYAILWTTARDCWNAEPSKRPTMVDICHRFSLDYTKPVGSAIYSGTTRSNETSHVSGFTEVAGTSPENAALSHDVDSNPQPVNQTTGPREPTDNRLLQLLGTAEHGDIGYMLDDGLCLKGTRVEILDRLDAWAADYQSSSRILLLKGQAGRGKSTIARSVSSRYRKRWGDNASSAIFHFRRGNEGLNTRPLLALARQLGSSANQRVRTAILRSVQDHEDVAQLRLEEQFEILFLQSFRQLGPNPPRILLVIDALDECSDHILISALFQLVKKHALSLPSSVKFLLTTRPEEHIVNSFKTFSNNGQEDLDAVDLALIDRDVRSYFTIRLSEIQQEYGFNADWLPPKAVNELVSLSQGLFQWAHAAMEYVRERPILNLQRLIKSPTNLLGLPALYKQILSTAFPLRKDIKEDGNFLALIQHVIGLLVVAHRPVSPVVLEYLLDNVSGGSLVSLDDLTTAIRDGILGRLGSILMLPATPDGPVHFMHASVRDFFTDPEQCEDKRFLINPSVHHTRLVTICFDQMEKNLKQNVLTIHDVFNMTSEALNLADQRLPAGLQYCCRSWSTHLWESNDDGSSGFAKIQRQLQDFCMEQLPYWIDCLNVTGVLSEVFDMIRQATKWLEVNKPPQFRSDIPASVLLSDTNDLCQLYFKHLSTYPHHITFSYLLQFQSGTILWDVYTGQMRQQALRIVRGPVLARSRLRVTLGKSAVLCVAFGPDGNTLASGHRDNTVCLWNMDTGELMQFPLAGHESRVNGLAFSPDSKTLASGSSDNTIRLWNTDTGESKGTPLVGHGGPITSIAYSPNGTTLASASQDSTIRLWNMDDGVPIGTPLFGHRAVVTSVTYSPDGRNIVSGSWDNTIRLWVLGTDTGASIGTKLLCRNPTWVMSIAYSSDGKILAFGLVDGAIRLWDMDAGKLMELHLAGHKSGVNGLAFSPDSKTLASGSNDKTIRLWDMDTRKPKETPPVGHNDQVTSIAYSTDGKTLASGSYDATLRLWTVHTGSGESMGSQLAKHQALVTSIACSSDAKTLASGSDDHQIRLWDINTGRQKGMPLVDYSTQVVGIAFSSDGKTLGSVSDYNQIQLWDIDTRKRKGKLLTGHRDRLMSITLSSNDEILAARSDDHRVRVWNIVTGAPMGTFPIGRKNHVSSIDYSTDDNTLVVRLDNGTTWSWSLAPGQRRTVPQPSFGDEARLTVVTYLLDGKTLALGLANYQIWLWDVGTGKWKGKPFVGHTEWINSIAVSSNGKTLASGSVDREIRLWNIDTSQQKMKLCIGSPGWSPNIALSSDGRILASGHGEKIRLWEINDLLTIMKARAGRRSAVKCSVSLFIESIVSDGREPEWFWCSKFLGEISAGSKLLARGLAFSPDGKTIASGLANRTVQLWDISTRKSQGAPLVGPQNNVTSLAFSSNGNVIASGSADGMIHLWNLSTGNQEGLSLFGHQNHVTNVTFSLDGGTLVSYSHSESGLETMHWRLGHGDMLMSTGRVADHGLEDELPHADTSDVRLDLESLEPYKRGWVFVRGKRCFWLPPEFYVDRDDHTVDISLFGERYLVLYHSNVHILDISAFL